MIDPGPSMCRGSKMEIEILELSEEAMAKIALERGTVPRPVCCDVSPDVVEGVRSLTIWTSDATAVGDVAIPVCTNNQLVDVSPGDPTRAAACLSMSDEGREWDEARVASPHWTNERFRFMRCWVEVLIDIILVLEEPLAWNAIKVAIRVVPLEVCVGGEVDVTDVAPEVLVSTVDL
jgi:hypothetical protein